jgi:hypothetical protein
MRILSAVLFLMLAIADPALAVDGTNLPGRDYAHFPAPSANSCRNSCGGDARCQAYTWVKPGYQGPAAQCWLKSSEPPIVKDACCDSGPRRYIDQASMRAEDRTDRPGSDFQNFASDSWKSCEAACAGDGQCAAWSYARAGVQGPRGQCWLKNQVPRPVANQGVVSGVRYRRPAVPID